MVSWDAAGARWLQRQQQRFGPALRKAGFTDDHLLLVLSILVGAGTGLGAHFFYTLLEWAFELTFSNEGLLSVGWYMLIAVPVIGGLAVGFIIQHFAREAKGHGVPEVMDAIYRRGAIIRRRVSVAKAVASALTIGSGGSAGTEGPIVQIGAAIGSSFGQLLGIKRNQMNTLVACGVAGGIAAIFDAPVAGVLFALEIFLRDFSFKTFSPIVFASVISASLTHALRPGTGGIFESVREQYIFNGSELPYYLVLGLLCAGAAVIFIRLLYAIEDLADGLHIPDALKPALGAALLGILGATYFAWANPAHGVPEFFGNGYPLIRSAIRPDMVVQLSLWSLLGLALLKLLATAFTLGSGGSGGIFAPSLFMGACVGGAFGIVLYKLGLIDQSSASAYAIVGMAAVVAGTTHAPLTSIVILYELTRDPRVVLPIMFAAIVATGVAKHAFRESIYTLKLHRRGVRVGRLADLTILRRIQADQVDSIPAPIVHPEDPLHKLLEMAEEYESPDFVVVDDDDQYAGMVVADDIKTALLQPEAVPLLLVTELSRGGVPSVAPGETLDCVMDKFALAHVNSLPVIGVDDQIKGLITRQAIMDRYHEELELMG